MQKFEIGDMVKLTKELLMLPLGSIGTVMDFSKTGLALVKFDDFRLGHDGFGLTISRKKYYGESCLYVDEKNLEILKVIEIYQDKENVIAVDKSTGKRTEEQLEKTGNLGFYSAAGIAFQRLIGEENIKDSKEKFKPYLESSRGGKYGYIGDSTEIEDVLGLKMRIGDTVDLYYFTAVGCEYRGEFPIVSKQGTPFVMGLLDCEFENGVSNSFICGQFKIVTNRGFEEIPDGTRINSVEYVKKERKGN